MPRIARTTSRIIRKFFNGSTLFNGTSSVISCGVLPSITTSQQEITISFWAKLNSANATVDAIMLANAGNNCTDGFCVRKYTDKKVFVYHGGTYVYFTPKYNTWNFYTIVIKRATSIEFFENGVLKESIYTSVPDYSFVNGSTPFRIGATGTQWFRGQIGEVSIVPRVVTEAERYAMMNGYFPSDATNIWKLDDLPSSYLDSIGGATGTGTATVYSPDVPVQLRQSRDEEAMSSLSFDGVDDGITLNYESLGVFNTISARARIFTKKVGLQSILVRAATFADKVLQIHADSTLRFTLALTSGNISLLTTKKIVTNCWYDIVATYDGATMSIIVDGQVWASVSATGTLVNTNTNWNIANRATELFNGFIKDTRMWKNAVFTPQQIRDLHFNNIVPTTGLVLDLPMNEGAGATVYDKSGNGNNGAISGATWSSNVPSKARKIYGGNLVDNGDLSYVPVVNVPTTTSARWIDGTAGGSTDVAYKDLFGFFTTNRRGTATYSAMFDTSVLYKGKPTIKIKVTAQSGCEAAVRKTSNTGIGWSASAVGYIPIKPSTVYKAKIAIKTEGVLDGGANTNVNVSIAQVKGEKQYVTQAIPINNLFGTQDFIEYELTFTTNASARFADFIFEIRDTTGIAWFADIKLLEVGAARTLHP